MHIHLANESGKQRGIDWCCGVPMHYEALFTGQGVTTFTCRSEALWGLDDDEATLLSFFCMLPSISQATLTNSACTDTQ